MSMSYDAALITGAQIVEFTGVQDLANLAADGELALNTFALEAHRAIYRELEARGIDPTILTNEARLKSAIAYEALKRLALARYCGFGDQEVVRFREQVEQELRAFVPAVVSGDPPRAEGIPAVANFDDGWIVGPTGRSGGTQRIFDDIPRFW